MEEQELREYLESPVCTLIPHKTKILSCVNGHQLCQACYNKMTDVAKKCPQGSCKYNSPPTRFRMVETMISKANINLNCKNAGQGCQVEDKKEVLNEHTPECLHRLVICPEVHCLKRIIISELENHFVRNAKTHGKNEPFENTTLWLEEKSLADTDDICWETRFMNVDGCRF